MIELAVIASTPHLGDLACLGSIDMALTHLVLRRPDYAAFYRARARAGVTVMLDNSAYELEETTGAGLTAEPVLDAARAIDATVIVCQDVLFDGPATITATREFLNTAARQGVLNDNPPRFMGVPQGTTRAEWLCCYQELVAMPEISMIGLSKLSVPRCFLGPVAEARLQCVAELLATGAPKPLHLLGGDRSLPWELAEHRHRGHDQFDCTGVRSNDSSFAFWYAATGIPVDTHTHRGQTHASTKPDLHTRLTDTQLATALANVGILRHAAGNPAPPPAAALISPSGEGAHPAC